jgi:hypothetical protein
MNEFTLKAFRTEADILNKGISRNIPNIFGNTSLDPNTSHSIWNMNNWTGNNGGGGDEGPSESEQAAAAEDILSGKKKDARAELEAAFSGYGLDDTNSAYFKKIGRNYRDFAMNAPVTGIRDQRGDAMSDLVAQLARQGQLDSTTRTSREALAKKLFAKAQVDASVKGRNIGEGVRGELLAVKNQGLLDIDASTDPSSASNMAINKISAKSDPGTFDPMLDVFYELTKGLALRREAEGRKDRQSQIDSLFTHDSSAKNIG